MTAGHVTAVHQPQPAASFGSSVIHGPHRFGFAEPPNRLGAGRDADESSALATNQNRSIDGCAGSDTEAVRQ